MDRRSGKQQYKKQELKQTEKGQADRRLDWHEVGQAGGQTNRRSHRQEVRQARGQTDMSSGRHKVKRTGGKADRRYR